MKVSIKEINGLWTAEIEGSLDSITAPQFEQDIKPLIDHIDKEVILDCANMNYISSAGLRQFLVIRKEALARGGSVTIINTQENVRKVFVMTRFISLFNFRD